MELVFELLSTSLAKFDGGLIIDGCCFSSLLAFSLLTIFDINEVGFCGVAASFGMVELEDEEEKEDVIATGGIVLTDGFD